MGKWLLRTLPALLHVMVSSQYFRFVVEANEDKLSSVLIYGFITLTLATAAATMLVSKGQWRQLLISLVATVVWLLGLLLVPQNINPLALHNSKYGEDYGAGILLFVYGFPLSLISLIFGTIAGVMVVQLREQIRLFRQ